MSRKSPRRLQPRWQDRRREQSRTGAPAAQRRLPPPARVTLGVIALALLLTIDDRYPGAIADGRQTSWTAVALAETGEIGQARGRDFTWRRPEGDAVSRYGMGMSLAQVPAAWLSPAVEGQLGPGSSQPLFLVTPILFVCLAAWAAGWVAVQLGAAAAGATAAVLLASIASPLGSYAALDLSEPMQAASLSLTFAGAVGAAHSDASRRQAILSAGLAGFAAGLAVLTKSSLLVVAPFALLPLMARGGGPLPIRSRVAVALGGFALPAAIWLWFEFDRFGQVFASYGGEGFTHPLLDGAWRLLVGPNRGLFLYFPAALLAVAALFSVQGEGLTLRRTAVLGALGVLAALLALAAPWWAWHGVWGWGPRLLVPAVPVVAAASVLVLHRWPSWAQRALVAASLLINVPGLLQNAAPLNAYTAACDWPVADELAARSLAGYAWRQDTDGTFRVSPDHVLAKTAAASPLLTHAWFFEATQTTVVGEAARRLRATPWTEARPDIACAQPGTAELLPSLLRRPGWTMWGRGFWPDPAAPGFPGVYDEGLLDQVVRAQQLNRAVQALELARKYGRLVPGGEADAQILESLRLLGRRAEAVEYLSTLSRERRSEPRINVVLALFERDAGNEQMARALLGSVVAGLAGTPAEQAINTPLSAWPRDLMSMTSGETDQVGR